MSESERDQDAAKSGEGVYVLPGCDPLDTSGSGAKPSKAADNPANTETPRAEPRAGLVQEEEEEEEEEDATIDLEQLKPAPATKADDTKAANKSSDIYDLAGLVGDDDDDYEFVDLEQDAGKTDVAESAVAEKTETEETATVKEPEAAEKAEIADPAEKSDTTDAAEKTAHKSSGVYELGNAHAAPQPVQERAVAPDATIDVEALSLPEPAPGTGEMEDETVQEVRKTIEELEEAATAEADDDLARSALLDRARGVLSRARPVVDTLPKGKDAGRNALRDELLDHYFALSRRVEALEKASEEANQRNLASVRRDSVAGGPPMMRPTGPAAAVKKRPSRRVVAMGAVFGVLAVVAGVRISFFLAAESGAAAAEPELVHERRGDGVFVRLEKGGKLVRDLERGVPVLTALQLSPTKKGGLKVVAEVIDRDSAATTVTYTWYKDGEVIRTEDTADRLTAEDLEPPGLYKVEAVASDGTHRSKPMVTQEVEL